VKNEATSAGRQEPYTWVSSSYRWADKPSFDERNETYSVQDETSPDATHQANNGWSISPYSPKLL